MTGSFLRVPDEALAQALAIIARTGGGKSFTARVLVEPLIERGARVCIIDPTGVWWGLRLKPDGKTPSGLPVVILGGDHADIEITSHQGAAAARIVAETKASVILDVADFSVRQRDRFAEAFFDTLYREWPRGPLTLVIDEADAFAPQRPMPEQRVMASRLEQIVRRGRVRGFRPWMITQRPAVLNKDVLGMVATMICLQITLPHDQDAVERWVRGHADPAQGRALMESLPRLNVGEGWVWSPRSGVLDRGRFPMIKTFDSMRAPDDDEEPVLVPALSRDDISGLGARLKDLAAEAEANDPAALKQRIADLERRLEGEPASAAVVDEAYARGVRHGIAQAEQDAVAKSEGARQRLNAAIEMLEGARDQLVIAAIGPNQSVTALTAAVGPERKFQAPPAPPPERAAEAPAGGLGKGQRSILTALAQHPRGLDRVQVALLAGYAHNGGGFRNYLGALKSAGLIDQDGEAYRITAAGREQLGPVPPLPTGSALLGYWRQRLGKAERLILDSLERVAPRPMGQADVARAAGYEPEGGGFRNSVGRLRTLALISGPKDALRLAPELVGR